MRRRTFLRSTGLAVGLPFVLDAGILRFLGNGEDDGEICKRKFDLALRRGLEAKPIGEVVVEVGRSFIGTPYLANALEQAGPEHLVVNLRGLDCVSFYENCLVFARCIKLKKLTFDDYRAQLTFIRYRGGIIDGYPSRLHYTSDYFADNEQKGVVRLVTKEIGGEPFVKTVNFMSTHAESYAKLKERPADVPLIAAQEAEITKREKSFVPKDRVAAIAANIANGDIIGITTNLDGLDVTHTGIAIRLEGALRFMHAPITGSNVQITEAPLAEYLATFKKDTGIMVARPLEPKA
jgi:hypothetical protein